MRPNGLVASAPCIALLTLASCTLHLIPLKVKFTERGTRICPRSLLRADLEPLQ
jgi:hypothetical protein